MNTTGKIMIGFLTGTLVGIVAGLLTAPSTGKKTRKDLQKKSKKIAKRFRGYVGMNATPAVKSPTSNNGKSSLQVS